jgi:hypothetical protein
MSQPSWKFVTNLGDATPLEYGGLFIYTDETGVYPPEMERVKPIEDEQLEIHRVSLDRYKMLDGHLVPYNYDVTWPHLPRAYNPWFAEDLGKVADYVDMKKEHIVDALCSDDPVRLAAAYRAIGDYHGWENLDSYPHTVSQDEARKRYKEECARG